MKNISKEELNEILQKHKMWLNGEGGKRADLENTNLKDVYLRNANLQYANLKDANLELVNLRGSNLRYANLQHANLQYTNLAEVNLQHANLSYANLWDANLRGANLSYTNLSYTDLRGADLRYADLNNSNLWDANLSYANLNNIETNMNTIGYNLVCPEEGSFIGYKIARGCIVKLLILEDSKRSSGTTCKCRCDKAKVLEITEIKTGRKVNEVSSNYDSNFIYRVGEIITVDNFDDNRWNECSTGIHFFMNKDNALNY